MASVYKKARDKKKKRSCWYFTYSDETGRRRTEKGFTDKGLTEQLASKREHEVMLRKRGLIDPEMERIADHKKAQIGLHLDAFERSLGKNSQKHVKLTMSRIRKVVEGCDFQTMGDFDAETVEGFLVDFREEEQFGHRTYNHYIQAIDSFCNWCVQNRRLVINPLIGLERLNAETDVRRKRRALLPEEFSLLVTSARTSGVSIQCYDGETRARIYIISYMTGLRRKEIAKLMPRSFQLDGEQPILTVEAACSKHRREDVLPLHAELVAMLRGWLDGLGPDDVLFPKLAKRRTWLMVKKDLERVGIPYKTSDGVADFHAAGRHTHITELLRNGATVPEAMELARHSDVKMTMRYTHIGIKDQARALSGLPVPQTPQTEAKPAASAAPEEDDPEESWQRPGSAPDVSGGHSTSSTVTTVGDDTDPKKCQNPCESKGFDADGQQVSPDGSDDTDWRRREQDSDFDISTHHLVVSSVTTILSWPSTPHIRHLRPKIRHLPDMGNSGGKSPPTRVLLHLVQYPFCQFGQVGNDTASPSPPHPWPFPVTAGLIPKPWHEGLDGIGFHGSPRLPSRTPPMAIPKRILR